MKPLSIQPQGDWTIERLLDACPRAAHVLMRHRMACVGCVMARFETINEAALAYHLDPVQFLRELRRRENVFPGPIR